MNRGMVSEISNLDNTPVFLNGQADIETIVSAEVAEMLEVEHSNLLKKIDSITSSLVKVKIDFYKYWKESTYKNLTNNKTCRCYRVTKLGCEFLANKMTGDKGNIFTSRYIDKFNSMKNYIKEGKTIQLTAKEQLELHYKYSAEIDEKVEEVKADVQDLKDNLPLFNIDCKELQALVRRKGIEVLGGYQTLAYRDNSTRGKVYTDIQRQLKREFGVEKYEAIKRSQVEEAKRIIAEYKAPLVLRTEIESINSQIAIE